MAQCCDQISQHIGLECNAVCSNHQNLELAIRGGDDILLAPP